MNKSYFSFCFCWCTTLTSFITSLFCCYASSICDDNSKTSLSDRNSLQNAEINVSEKFKKWKSKCFLYDKNIIDGISYGYFCRLKFCFTIQYFSFLHLTLQLHERNIFISHFNCWNIQAIKARMLKIIFAKLKFKVSRSATICKTQCSWFNNFFRGDSFSYFTSSLLEHPDTWEWWGHSKDSLLC